MNAVLQSVQSLGSMRFVAILGVLLLLIASIIFLSVRLSSPVMTPLYGELTPEDSGAIVSELSALGVEFEIADGGTQVLVHGSDVLRLRMALAQKGIPSTGSVVGYEVFDREQALGTSNFVLNVNLLRALEGELARTISSLSSIKTARVHIVMPKRNLFERTRIEPSSSIVLAFYSRERPSPEEIEAVRQLVSTSVPGLSTKRITIIDSKGRVLSRGEREDETGGVASAKADEFKIKFEKRLEETIIYLLSQALGDGNVTAEVTADMSFDRVTVSSEEFDPDSQVARSVQSNEELIVSQNTDGGAVTVGNNLPNAEGDQAAAGSSEQIERFEETVNYEVSKVITNKISEVGTINQLSVAVLVDGQYDVQVNEDTDEVTRTYRPLTDEQIVQLRTLVETAIGYDPARGDTVEIVNMQFASQDLTELIEDDPLDWLKRDLDSIVKTIVVGIVAILAILLVIRPLVTRAFDIAPTEFEENETGIGDISTAELLADTGEMDQVDIDSIQSSLETSPVKRVNELIENNPEETVSVIRTWMMQK